MEVHPDCRMMLFPAASCCCSLPELPVLHLLLSRLCSLLVYWLNNAHKELLWLHQDKEQVKLRYFLYYAVLPQNAVQVLSGFFVFRNYALDNRTRD